MFVSPDAAQRLASQLLGNDERAGWPASPPHPAALGRYRITRLIGTGGMGRVYEAEQDNPQRRVAIKVIRHELVGASMLRRFEHETRILGRLEHPGIARIYEADHATTADGITPYFAMEYVEGTPVTEYIRQRGLAVKQILELFLKICDAVEHAHRRGVIHRDLKPGNILVTHTEGQPKVLDFGIARATDGDVRVSTLQTDLGKLVGTLPYMSPEQAAASEGEAIDTRSDVYSLGVVLYEALAGRPPFEIARGMIPEALRIIREHDPAPLDATNRTLAGDLPTLVAKAIEKEPDRRYASVGDLAADIRRYLNDEPILARPASAWYRARKFAKRNRITVAAACVTTAGVLLGAGTSTVLAFRQARLATSLQEALDSESKHRQEADAQAELTQGVAAFLLEMLASADPDQTRGASLTVREMLDAAADRVDQHFENNPQLRATLEFHLGRIYRRLGDGDRALQHITSSIEIYETLPGDPYCRLAESLSERGLIQMEAAHFDEAVASCKRAYELIAAGLGPDDPNTLVVLTDLGAAYSASGRLDEAEATWGDALARLERVLGPDHPYTLACGENLAGVRRKKGDAAGAVPILERAFQAAVAAGQEDTMGAIKSRNNLAMALYSSGDLARAQGELRATISTSTRVLGAEHQETLTYKDNLAGVLSEDGQLEEALSLSHDVGTGRERVLGRDHPDTLRSWRLSASLLMQTGKYSDAEAIFARIVPAAEARASAQNGHAPGSWRADWGACLTQLGRYESAEKELLEALEVLQEALGPVSEKTRKPLMYLIQLYEVTGRHDLAVKYTEQLEHIPGEAGTEKK